MLIAPLHILNKHLLLLEHIFVDKSMNMLCDQPLMFRANRKLQEIDQTVIREEAEGCSNLR